MSDRKRLKSYAEALAMWISGFNTAEIAKHLAVPEPTIERWVWNYREMMQAA